MVGAAGGTSRLDASKSHWAEAVKASLGRKTPCDLVRTEAERALTEDSGPSQVGEPTEADTRNVP